MDISKELFLIVLSLLSSISCSGYYNIFSGLNEGTYICSYDPIYNTPCTGPYGGGYYAFYTSDYANNGCKQNFENVPVFFEQDLKSEWYVKVFGIVQEETFFSVNFQSNNDGQHWTDCYDIHFNYPFATMCGNHGCCVASMYQQPYQCVNTDGASYIYNAETNQLELNFASAGQFAQSTVWMINSTYGFTGWDISGVTWSSGFQFHASYNNCTSC